MTIGEAVLIIIGLVLLVALGWVISGQDQIPARIFLP